MVKEYSGRVEPKMRDWEEWQAWRRDWNWEIGIDRREFRRVLVTDPMDLPGLEVVRVLRHRSVKCRACRERYEIMWHTWYNGGYRSWRRGPKAEDRRNEGRRLRRSARAELKEARRDPEMQELVSIAGYDARWTRGCDW